MTKAKLATRKKSDEEPIVDYGLQRVVTWTTKALTELQQNSKAPIIVELTNGDYTVGTSRVEKVSSVCWKVGELDFTDKRSAIFYCALSHVSKFADARELYAVDAIVGKLDLDKATFRLKLDKAHAERDQFKIDLFSSRYEEAKTRLAMAKQELEKILIRAKYMNDLGNLK